MLLGIDHIEIMVEDVKAYTQYLQTIGFELLQETTHHGGAAELQIPGDGTIFEVIKVAGGDNPGINHIAFKVDSAHESYDDLKSKGIQFEAFPTDDIPFFVPDTGRWIINFRDPAGWRQQMVAKDRKEPQAFEADYYKKQEEQELDYHQKQQG